MHGHDTTAPLIGGYSQFINTTIPTSSDSDGFTFTCSWSRSVTDLLGLLYALLTAKKAGTSYDLAALWPQTPDAAYSLIPHSMSMLGIDEPSGDMIARAISKECGVSVTTFGDTVTIDCDAELAGELSYLAAAYKQSQLRAFRRLVKMIATTINLPVKMLLLSLLVGLELPIDEWSEMNVLPLVATWVATAWAPIGYVFRRLRNVFVIGVEGAV